MIFLNNDLARKGQKRRVLVIPSVKQGHNLIFSFVLVSKQ